MPGFSSTLVAGMPRLQPFTDKTKNELFSPKLTLPMRAQFHWLSIAVADQYCLAAEIGDSGPE
jgi:hypothetical protein